VLVLSIGKAAIKMARAAHAVFGSRVSEGLVISNAGIPFESPWPVIHGGHPIPDAGSLRAGEAALDLVGQFAQPDSLIMFFISGGGSAQLELPLAGLSLEDVATANRVLVTSSTPIAEINAIRCALSQVKGGGLAAAAGPARQVSFYLSDVEPGDLPSIASGPSYPSACTQMERARILEEHGLRESLPERVLAALSQERLMGDCAAQAEHHLILDSDLALKRVVEDLRSQGTWRVEAAKEVSGEDVAAVAHALLEQACSLRAEPGAGPILLVSMGEAVCPVQGAGVGGRNQELVLRLALEAENRPDFEYAFLSAGTDGIDGNSPAAGALVDRSSLSRARTLGMDPLCFLNASDSYGFFSRLGDSLVIGPSGNNLRDLRLLLLA
jgi:hydroxypyruvate reductase